MVPDTNRVYLIKRSFSIVKRKVYISVLLSFTVTSFFGEMTSLIGGYKDILFGWAFISLLVFPWIFLYALPVLLVSDEVTRNINSKLYKSTLFLGIQIIFSLLWVLWDIGMGVISFISVLFLYLLNAASLRLNTIMKVEQILKVTAYILISITLLIWLLAGLINT
jgi:ABC-type multidrug transport system permease subunit